MGRLLSKTGNLKTRKVKKKKDLAMEDRKKRRERRGRRGKERGEMDFKVKRKTYWGKHLQSKTDTHW